MNPALLVGPALLFGVFWSYLSTMYPTISAYRDHGELATAAATLGSVHAPGYPLYLTLGRAFCAVPFGSAAYRTNLHSAAAGAVAVWLVYRAALRLMRTEAPGGRMAALAGAAALAAIPPLWRLAQVGEMYTTAAVWAAAFVLMLTRWWERPGRKTVAGLALLAGLGTGVHMTLLMLLPAAAVTAGRRVREFLRPAAVCLFVLGAGVALVSPVRSAGFPRFDWGHPATMPGFLAVVTRQYAGAFTLQITGENRERSLEAAVVQVGRQGRDFARSWTPIFLALAALGAWQLIKGGWGQRRAGAEPRPYATVPTRPPLRDRPYATAPTRMGLGLLVAFLGLGPGFRIMANMPDDGISRAILEPHDILPGVILAVWAAAGTVWAAGLARARWPRAGVLVPAAAAALACGLLWGRRAGEDRRHRYLASDTGRMMLRAADPGAVLLARGDIPIFLLNYLTVCDGLRPDVRVVPNNIYPWRAAELKRRFPDLTAGFGEEYAYDFRDRLVRHNLGRVPILLVGVTDLPVGAPVPEGLVQRVFQTAPGRAERAAVLERGRRLMTRLGVYRPPVTARRVRHYYEREIVLNLVGANYELGRAELDHGRAGEAAGDLARAAGLDPGLAPIKALLAQARRNGFPPTTAGMTTLRGHDGRSAGAGAGGE